MTEKKTACFVAIALVITIGLWVSIGSRFWLLKERKIVAIQRQTESLTKIAAQMELLLDLQLEMWTAHKKEKP